MHPVKTLGNIYTPRESRLNISMYQVKKLYEGNTLRPLSFVPLPSIDRKNCLCSTKQCRKYSGGKFRPRKSEVKNEQTLLLDGLPDPGSIRANQFIL